MLIWAQIMKNDIHFRYLTTRDQIMLSQSDPEDILARIRDIALNAIARMPPDIHLVSGPISTGGVGNPAGNIAVFKAAIEHLAEVECLNIFSQIPFEAQLIIFNRKWKAEHGPDSYPVPILTEFYAPLFQTGAIKRMHFLHGYRSSHGARWEHDQCARYHIGKRYLSKALSRTLLAKALVQTT